MQENLNRNCSKGLNSKDEFKNHRSNGDLLEVQTLTNLTNNKMASALLNNDYRSKTSNKNESPVLSELLKSNEIVPYVVQFDCIKKHERLKINGYNANNNLNEVSNFNSEKPSYNYSDYIEVSVEHTKQMERMGIDNSLFLAVARSLLFKVHFDDEKYRLLIYNLSIDDERQKIAFDTDSGLQELLRKKLCMYWLSFVIDGKFKLDNCKYTKEFTNVFDFVYQVYQIGVNNFSNNKLFSLYALEDLAHIIKMRICLFYLKSSDDPNSVNMKIYESFTPESLISDKNSSKAIKDHIFLSLSSNGSSKFKYKLLLPKSQEKIVKERLLLNKDKNKYFFRNKSAYSNYMVLLSIADIKKCFSTQELISNINLNLFLKFLSESSVHTLISVYELKFDLTKNPIQMATFLNEIWGQNHFILEEILLEMDENNNALKFKKNSEKETKKSVFHAQGPSLHNVGKNSDNKIDSDNNQIKRIRKSSISTNPSANVYETLKSYQDDSNQISKVLSNKISKMDIESKEISLHRESATHTSSDHKTNSNEEKRFSYNRKRSHSDNFSFEPSSGQKFLQDYFLPPAFPKIRQATLNFPDVKYNQVLPPKLITFSDNKQVIDNNEIPPCKTSKVKQIVDSNDSKCEEAIKNSVKSRTRTRTLTQLNTRQSIGSCLSNLWSLSSGHKSIATTNSDSSLFYNAKI